MPYPGACSSEADALGTKPDGVRSHVVAVAEAIAYAHEHRIRDLKPANVIVGAFGETIVIDWGLAKDLAAADAAPAEDVPRELPRAYELADLAANARTEAGELLGTPAYMPPEQMRGVANDERVDVFALGGILYHVLTGRAPYETDSIRDALARIAAGRPVPVREREPQVSAELAAIVEKAMAADPAARYPSAKELARDLARFQAGELVGAHRYTPGRLAMRFVRRNRTRLAVGAGLLDRDPTEALAWLATYPRSGPAFRDVGPIAAEAAHRGVARWVHELFPLSRREGDAAEPEALTNLRVTGLSR